MAGVDNQQTAAVAQYGLYLIAGAAVIVWVTAKRRDQVNLAIETVFVMVLVLAMIKIAGAVHDDPRPFAVNPTLKPLFAHAPDNGFPSDHTALAAAISGLVTQYRRRVGGVMAIVTLAIGFSRVAANVHHRQDIAAGLVIGYLASLLGITLWRRAVQPRLTGKAAELVGPQ